MRYDIYIYIYIYICIYIYVCVIRRLKVNPLQQRIFKIALSKTEIAEGVLLFICRSINLDCTGLAYSVLRKEARRRRNSKVAASFARKHNVKSIRTDIAKFRFILV